MFKKVFTFCLIPLLIFCAVPANAAGKEQRNWQSEIVYYLIVDRFNNGDDANDINTNTKNALSFQGGDFQGIINRLDYLKDLGFTAILLNPIFDNDEKGYAGDRIINFYKPDEHYGSLKKFQELVKEAHKRDMKIMLSFETNQVSPEHPWVTDQTRADWLKGKTDDGLISLNQKNPAVNQYFIKAGKWWVQKTNIDGYYLNNADKAPIEFWKDFNGAVRSVKKNFFLLGDVHSNDINTIKKFEQAGFDGFYDYPQNKPLRSAFSDIDQSTKPLLDIVKTNESTYQGSTQNAIFFDNPYMTRFTRDMVNANKYPGTRWKLALTYLYTQPEIPIVYYGSEIAIDGGNAPENRPMMNFRADKDLMDYMTQISELRIKNPSLIKGSFTPLYDKNGMTVYKREYKGDVNIVAINNTSATHGVSIDTSQFKDDKELRGLLDGGIVRADNGKYKIVLERETSEIYKVVDKTGINYGFIAILVIVWILFFAFIYAAKKKAKKN
ncbi:alpha-amylase family glycosyl hydrolase [Bacillus sp. FJAT-49736]|uniref:alpha-amylase family glycosyl hydrolase n=1 Tax=Bacillus sp. FJAT-49736 TaxID=2833582 RepID=UPI001BC9B119|nr:alpha-amylase family glycosyl hydrolase [Bacillus sp. FJAT-49736]MBS4172019.1 alpha-amylase [Bacillus sp. FJAT-49736]